ncbi:hypothetical protein [Croceicoccus gelatinilyticus]|uniref:hypothetical protein n=1 Tax=Croceicoccus gelatinilyticus TaxID=2835536 RepID=UPI001BCC0F24|nr:hypothetical protein [Croceicoccus gelatinilyticus]MBS7669318.1 hypothetical protein [Croceicoccus gelatinilyticus]
MTFWQFVDRRLDRMHWPRARTVAGAGSFLMTLIVLLMIYVQPELAKDDLFKMLAQGVVIQGFVGLAMPFWFGDKERAAGSQKVKVTNDPAHPVPVDDGDVK